MRLARYSTNSVLTKTKRKTERKVREE
jgi:hypothetical protein